MYMHLYVSIYPFSWIVYESQDKIVNIYSFLRDIMLSDLIPSSIYFLKTRWSRTQCDIGKDFKKLKISESESCGYWHRVPRDNPVPLWECCAWRESLLPFTSISLRGSFYFFYIEKRRRKDKKRSGVNECRETKGGVQEVGKGDRRRQKMCNNGWVERRVENMYEKRSEEV